MKYFKFFLFFFIISCSYNNNKKDMFGRLFGTNGSSVSIYDEKINGILNQLNPYNNFKKLSTHELISAEKEVSKVRISDYSSKSFKDVFNESLKENYSKIITLQLQDADGNDIYQSRLDEINRKNNKVVSKLVNCHVYLSNLEVTTDIRKLIFYYAFEKINSDNTYIEIIKGYFCFMKYHDFTSLPMEKINFINNNDLNIPKITFDEYKCNLYLFPLNKYSLLNDENFPKQKINNKASSKKSFLKKIKKIRKIKNKKVKDLSKCMIFGTNEQQVVGDINWFRDTYRTSVMEKDLIKITICNEVAFYQDLI